MRILLLILFVFMLCSLEQIMFSFNKIIVDSDISFEEAVVGTKAPKEIIQKLCIINVKYYSFDGKLHSGQLVVNQAVKDEIIELFQLIEQNKFPIGKAIPIVKYGWDDNKSMEDNNTSSFNYRNIAGTDRLSKHSYGLAIDINPLQNPVVYPDGKMVPKKAKYDLKSKGTLSDTSFIVKFLKAKGWRWGGEFQQYKDYHHFDKELE